MMMIRVKSLLVSLIGIVVVDAAAYLIMVVMKEKVEIYYSYVMKIVVEDQ